MDPGREPSPTPSPAALLSDQSRAFLKNILQELGFADGTSVLGASNTNIVPLNPVELGKRKAPPPRNAAYQQIIDAAKFTPRGADAYWDIYRVLTYGCTNLRPDGEHAIATIPAVENAAHHAAVFTKIFATCRSDVVPVLRYLYNDSERNPGPWKALMDRTQAAARHARTQDTNTFKNNLHIFLPVPGQDYFFPPLEVTTSKARRGLVHPQLRYLIMPWRDRAHFPVLVYAKPTEPSPELSEEAKSINAQIALGKYHPSASRFPSFCYAQGMHDPRSYRRNLFKNIVIVRGLRLLLVTRADANDAAGDALSSGCLASIHSIHRITAHILAYVIVQMRVAISNVPEWKKKESKKYSFSALYNKVLRAFDDEEDPELPNWAEETLDWLTERTFGEVEHSSRAQVETDEDDSEDEAVEQRKRRREAENVP